MRLGKMILKEIKQTWRDKQAMVMMVLFPLLLTVVLGAALSGMFELNSTPSKVSALYYVDDNSQLGQSFINFIPECEKMNLILTEEKDIDNAKQAVQKGDTSCFIYVNSGKITIFAREGQSFNASLADTLVKGFARTYDAYYTVLNYDQTAMTRLSHVNTGAEYTNDISLSRDKKPRAIDYYSLTMLTLIVMYGAMYGTASITDERKNKTLFRIFSAPVRNAELLISKIVGNVLAISGQIAFVFLIDKFFLNTYWGDNLLPIFIIILAQIIMVVSFGVGLGYLFKGSDAGMALIQTIIPVLAFLGGAYVNLDMIGASGFMAKLTSISPIKWINTTILQIVYAKDYSGFATTIIMCLAIAVLFLGLSALLSRKELKV